LGEKKERLVKVEMRNQRRELEPLRWKAPESKGLEKGKPRKVISPLIEGGDLTGQFGKAY